MQLYYRRPVVVVATLLQLPLAAGWLLKTSSTPAAEKARGLSLWPPKGKVWPLLLKPWHQRQQKKTCVWFRTKRYTTSLAVKKPSSLISYSWWLSMANMQQQNRCFLGNWWILHPARALPFLLSSNALGIYNSLMPILVVYSMTATIASSRILWKLKYSW